MNRRHINGAVFGLSAVLFTASCEQKVTTVVLDSGRNAELAKATCENARDFLERDAGMISQLTCAHITSCVESTAIVAACSPDMASELHTLETQIASEITADPKCADVHFVPSGERVGTTHWTLTIHFTPGQGRHAWDMSREPKPASVHGEGDAHDIAQRVCAAVMGSDSQKSN